MITQSKDDPKIFIETTELSCKFTIEDLDRQIMVLQNQITTIQAQLTELQNKRQAAIDLQEGG